MMTVMPSTPVSSRLYVVENAGNDPHTQKNVLLVPALIYFNMGIFLPTYLGIYTSNIK
jgi:hypothetical protein